MNRRRYDSGRFDKSSDRKDYNNYSRINTKDDYRGRYGNSSKYFDDKSSGSFRRPYKNTSYSSSRSADHRIKRSRNDDSRQNSSFISPRRNDLRPKTPPPPSIRSSGNNYYRGSHRNDNSFGHSHSYRNSFSPSRKRSYISGARNTSYRYNNTRLRQNSLRDSDGRSRVIRRKIIVSSSRKVNTIRNDRTRMIRLARIKRNKDSLKVKSPSKKSKEDVIDEKKTSSSNNECENEENDSTNKKNEQDVNEKEKDKDDGEKSIDENKSKNREDNLDVTSDSRRNRRSLKHESKSPERSNKASFIKLICVHCRIKCKRFTEYQSHIYSRTHRIAMRRVAIRQKAQLSRMRMEQRNVQRDLEENTKEDLGEQQYCLLCRLNYKTGKAKHQLSDHHKIMKKFLMPYCSTCHIAFKSPIVYQSHRCSLEHIKRKARDNKSDSEDSGSEMKVDLKEFTTVDSIGEIDEDDIEESDGDFDVSELNDESLGLKFVKKVDALYCEICEAYVTCEKDNEEEILYKHCRSKHHIKITKKILESEMEKNTNQEEATQIKKENIDQTIKDKAESEETIKEEVEENNDEDEDEEPILNIDIQSDKNCTENEMIEEAANQESN